LQGLEQKSLKADIEQIETLEGPLATQVAVAAGQVAGSRFSSLARDMATMSAGTVMAAVFNTLLVFLIPRLVSVEDFGYWRLFMLYAGYAGLVQAGFLDGALLRWVGRPLDNFRPELRLSLKFLLLQLLVLLAPVAVLMTFTLRTPARFIGLAVLVYPVLFNLSALLQYALQGSRQFKPVAFSAAAPAGIFLLLTFIWTALRLPNFRVLIGFYCVAWAIGLIYLWFRVRPLAGARSTDSVWSLGRSCILCGWPIVLANVGFGLVQSADRLVVSWRLPIHDFAQYSLAGSAMFVPLTAIAAIYRVFFSHAAAMEHGNRARIYGHASRFLLLAWSTLLPYFFVLEVVVRRFLPKYLAALPAAGILLLSVLFLAEIQILHTSFAYLYGQQRQFLYLTVVALFLAFSVGFATSIWLGTLVAVAFGQLAVLLVWWFINEWNLRPITGQRWLERAMVLVMFGWSTFSYLAAMKSTENVGLRILIYYALVGAGLFLTCLPEMKMLWKFFSRLSPQAAV
jgi:O-antigen/teichoic acid export membrane protein